MFKNLFSNFTENRPSAQGLVEELINVAGGGKKQVSLFMEKLEECLEARVHLKLTECGHQNTKDAELSLKNVFAETLGLCRYLLLATSPLDTRKSRLISRSLKDLAILETFGTRKNFLKFAGISTAGSLISSTLWGLAKWIDEGCKNGTLNDEVACVGTDITARKYNKDEQSIMPENWEDIVDQINNWVSKKTGPEEAIRISEWLRYYDNVGIDLKPLNPIAATARHFFYANKEENFDQYLKEHFFPLLFEVADELKLSPQAALYYIMFAGQHQPIDEQKREAQDSQKQMAFGAFQTFLLRQAGNSDLADLIQFGSYFFESQYNSKERVGTGAAIKASVVSLGVADIPAIQYAEGITSIKSNSPELYRRISNSHPIVVESLENLVDHKVIIELWKKKYKQTISQYIKSLVKNNDELKDNPFTEALKDGNHQFWDQIGLGNKSSLESLLFQITHWTRAWFYYLVETNRQTTFSQLPVYQQSLEKSIKEMRQQHEIIDLSVKSAKNEFMNVEPVKAIQMLLEDQIENEDLWLFIKSHASMFPNQKKELDQLLFSSRQLLNATLDHRDFMSAVQIQLSGHEYDLELQMILNMGAAKGMIEKISACENRPILKRLSTNPFFQASLINTSIEIGHVKGLIDEITLNNVDIPVNLNWTFDLYEKLLDVIEKKIINLGHKPDEKMLMNIFFNFTNPQENWSKMMSIYINDPEEYFRWWKSEIYPILQQFNGYPNIGGNILSFSDSYFVFFEENRLTEIPNLRYDFNQFQKKISS